MARYLVTGGAGFIGSHLTRALLSRGETVRVLDDFSTGKRENLTGPEIRGASGRLEVLEADLRDAARVKQAVRDVEVVFHEAAFVSVPESMERPEACLDVNVNGSMVLLEAARKAGVKRIVTASSAAVYGDSKELPLAEDSALHPLSPYAASKRVNELYAELYTRSLGIEVTGLRYFNVYGPRQNPGSVYAAVVPIFIRRLLDGKAVTIFGDGGQTRDLIYVGDVVRANLLAAQHPAAPGQIFNICTGQATSVLELATALGSLFPSSPTPEFGPPRAADIYASIGRPTKAENVLGFRAETSLSVGLKATVEWMR